MKFFKNNLLGILFFTLLVLLSGANWSNPTLSSNYADVLSELKNRDLSSAKMDYSADSNIPTGAKRLTVSERTIDSYNGSTWDVVLQGYKSGDIKFGFEASSPSGWLLMAGGTIGNASSGATVRANADTETLFIYLWTNLANSEAAVSSGRGVSAAADYAANKTITLPDMRQKFPLIKAASGTGATMGSTGGSIDHNHTGPSHTHSTPSAAIALPAHEHTIRKHYHSATGTGADIAINSSGLLLNARNNSTAGNTNYLMAASSTGANDAVDLDHAHAHSEFTGRVGTVTSGQNGDADVSTSNMTSATINVPAGTSGSGGTGNTGTNNPPFLVLNAFIKL